jgi:hypothetical protein
MEFFDSLDLKQSFALGTFATVFRLSFMPFWLVPTTVWGYNDLHLLGQSGRFIGVKFGHSVGTHCKEFLFKIGFNCFGLLVTGSRRKNGFQVIIFLTGIWLVDAGNPRFG